MICFEKNIKNIKMSSLGMIRFKSMGGYDLNEFKYIDISEIVTNL